MKPREKELSDRIHAAMGPHSKALEAALAPVLSDLFRSIDADSWLECAYLANWLVDSIALQVFDLAQTMHEDPSKRPSTRTPSRWRNGTAKGKSK